MSTNQPRETLEIQALRGGGLRGSIEIRGIADYIALQNFQ
jgi:hypothetical protein